MTLEETWQEFEKATIPGTVPQFQRETMRKTFYAAYGVAFRDIVNLSTENGVDAACARLSEIEFELSNFLSGEILKTEMNENRTIN